MYLLSDSFQTHTYTYKLGESELCLCVIRPPLSAVINRWPSPLLAGKFPLHIGSRQLEWTVGLGRPTKLCSLRALLCCWLEQRLNNEAYEFDNNNQAGAKFTFAAELLLLLAITRQQSRATPPPQALAHGIIRDGSRAPNDIAARVPTIALNTWKALGPLKRHCIA